jgi:DNA-binding transcriptional ArsR family regulator
MAATRATRTRTSKTTPPETAPRRPDDGTAPEEALPTTTAADETPVRPARKARAAKAEPPRPVGPSPEVRQAAMLLKQVSDPTRLQVLLLLAEQERNVSTLCADLGHQSQPAVSHHLALLRHGRLIEPRRQGKNNVYSLTDEGRKLAEAVRDMAG